MAGNDEIRRTDSRKTKKELIEELARLRARLAEPEAPGASADGPITAEMCHRLFETSPDGIVILDMDGTVEDANQALLDMLGYSLAELKTLPRARLLPEKWRAWEAREIFEKQIMTRGYSDPYVIDYVRKDGSEFPVELWGVLLRDEAGQPCMIWGWARDLTVQRRVEAELRQAHKMEAVGRLTGGIAHHYNNMLFAIQGNLDFLRERLAGDPVLEGPARRAIDTVDRAVELTRNLSTFARQQLLKPETIDVNDLILSQVEQSRGTLPDGVRMEFLARDGPVWTFADPGELRAALGQLISNAEDAMPQGGDLTVELGLTRHRGGRSADGGVIEAGTYVELAVRDTGAGIAPEIKDKILDPFFTTKDMALKSGLGLSVVEGFVRQSGGHLEIESEVGVGTTVRLFLPRASAPAGRS